MIPKFNDYFIINESKTLKDIKENKGCLTYGEIKKKFIAQGYEFLGNVYTEAKTINAFAYKEIMNSVPDDIYDIVKKYGVESGYVSYTPDKSIVSINIDDKGNTERLLQIFGGENHNVDKINSCYTKTNKLYYVLWNEDLKYFYFLRIESERGYVNPNGMIGFVELWIKIRTSGIDTVIEEVQSIGEEYSERDRLKQEEREKKEKERKEKEELDRIKEEKYQEIVSKIQADVEANPDNYEEVKYEDLPGDVKSDLKEEDKENVRYVEYIEHGAWDPYDQESVICYVNDDSLTKGYKYSAVIDHAKPGTYWGD